MISVARMGSKRHVDDLTDAVVESSSARSMGRSNVRKSEVLQTTRVIVHEDPSVTVALRDFEELNCVSKNSIYRPSTSLTINFLLT